MVKNIAGIFHEPVKANKEEAKDIGKSYIKQKGIDYLNKNLDAGIVNPKLTDN